MEQEGGLDIICMLYRDPKLRALEHLGVFFKLALERFPYKLDSFLRMVEAIVVSEENYKKVFISIMFVVYVRNYLYILRLLMYCITVPHSAQM